MWLISPPIILINIISPSSIIILLLHPLISLFVSLFLKFISNVFEHIKYFFGKLSLCFSLKFIRLRFRRLVPFVSVVLLVWIFFLFLLVTVRGLFWVRIPRITVRVSVKIIISIWSRIGVGSRVSAGKWMTCVFHEDVVGVGNAGECLLGSRVFIFVRVIFEGHAFERLFDSVLVGMMSDLENIVRIGF